MDQRVAWAPLVYHAHALAVVPRIISCVIARTKIRVVEDPVVDLVVMLIPVQAIAQVAPITLTTITVMSNS